MSYIVEIRLHVSDLSYAQDVSSLTNCEIYEDSQVHSFYSTPQRHPILVTYFETPSGALFWYPTLSTLWAPFFKTLTFTPLRAPYFGTIRFGHQENPFLA